MVRTTSGTMAGSQASTRPPARRVKPVLNLASAKRTVLPECRLKRSYAQSSRCKRLFRTGACTAGGENKGGAENMIDRKAAVEGTRVSVCVMMGGRRIIKKKKTILN